MVTSSPLAASATTADAFCFSARIPTSDMFYIVAQQQFGTYHFLRSSISINVHLAPCSVLTRSVITWNLLGSEEFSTYDSETLTVVSDPGYGCNLEAARQGSYVVEAVDEDTLVLTPIDDECGSRSANMASGMTGYAP